MKKNALWQVALGLNLLAVTSLRVQAAGFGLYEASARGNAMGGALVGDTGDASANYYNPANLTDLKGTDTMVGLSVVHPDMDVTAKNDKNNLDADWFTLPHLYASQQLAEDWFIGIGLYSEYGLGTSYDSDWPLKSSSTATTLKTVTFNPNLAYKVSDRLSVAAGFRAMYLSFENHKTVYDNTRISSAAPIYGSMTTDVEGDSWGYGYNLAVSYKLTDTLDAGFVYRSRVRQTVKGDIDVVSSSTPLANLLPYGEASARGAIELPPSWTAGLNYRPVEKLNVGLTAIYTEWGTYDDLSMTFGSTENAQLPDTSEEKNWHNVWRLGLGAEYLLTERWSVQCGYVYDMDPIDKDYTDTMLPPGDRHIVSAGLGYAIGTWKFYGSYGLIIVEPVDRTVGSAEVDFDDGFCNIFALSAGKSF
ncbi:MAG TPA: outer membrane protein transport protein [Kiritimatiellia bacterium]|nr:outer membrane protein transport protein [Kiritimatiellia bacterium]HPS07041.1 outer membrane protein transport protein [Kiritimatiellia bacterium]